MDEKKFWQVIEKAGENLAVVPIDSNLKRENFKSESSYLNALMWERVQAGEELERKRIALIENELDKLSVSELEEFQNIFLSKLVKCFSGYLEEVASLLTSFFVGIDIYDWDGSSIDVYAWLIYQGQSVYDSALENPDSIAPLLSQDSNYADVWEFAFFSIASSLYREKSGKDHPVHTVTYLVDNYPKETPELKFKNPDDFRKRCPQLHKRLSSEIVQIGDNPLPKWFS